MKLDSKIIWITVASAAVLTLAAANLAGTRNPSWPTDWYELAPLFPETDQPYFGGWHIDAELVDVFGLASLSGKVKLLSSAKPTWGTCQIGYVIDVDALPIPRDKIPEKYKDTPITEVMWNVHFEFHLMDADGFEIMTVESPKHHFTSGKTKRIQSQTEPAVTIAQANRLSAVKVAVFVDESWIVTD
jgi:hypothetical protein